MKRYVVFIIILTSVMCCLFAATALVCRGMTRRGLEALAVTVTEASGSDELYLNALLNTVPTKESANAGAAIAEEVWHTDYPFELFMGRLWSNGAVYCIGAMFALAVIGTTAFLIIDGRQRIRYRERLTSRVSAALRGEERFRAENESEQLTARLFAEIDRLNEVRESSAEELHQYVENVAHELKTPASGIILSLDLMEKNGMTEEKLSAARGCAMRIGTYVSGLLSLARLRAGKVRFRFEPFDIGELVREIADELSANGVKVEISGSGSVVNGDRVRIKEALVNLIMNSSKHSGSHEPVRVELECSAHDTAVRIRDNGAGISRQAIERYAVGSEDGTSSGIGLSLAEAVAKRHSGKLILRNCPNGAEAELLIPVFDLKKSFAQ